MPGAAEPSATHPTGSAHVATPDARNAAAATDAPDVQRLAGDFAIADTTAHIPHPYEDGVAESWIATHAEAFAQGTGLSLAIAARSGGNLIGAISLMQIAPGHQAELGYWIGRPYWGNGYCTEAGEAMLRHAFGELSLIRVHALHLSRNPASDRVQDAIDLYRESHVDTGIFETELYPGIPTLPRHPRGPACHLRKRRQNMPRHLKTDRVCDASMLSSGSL